MNITEFLEARIAEDEAVVAYAEPHEMSGGYSYADVGGLSEVLTVGASRVLAECAAKRAIIDLWENVDDMGGVNDVDAGYVMGVDASLKALASVYSDHADYQQEWAL